MLIYLNLVGKYLLIMEKMSFNLNTFIEKYKYHLPKYFLSLNEKKTSKQDIFNAKSVLISFIKEYFKHNNNKFNRTRFNVNFINKFLYELIPAEYYELTPIPPSKIQTIILNFINYLSLQQVLDKNIQREIIKSLNNAPVQHKDNMKKLVDIEEEYDPDSFSEKYLEKLMNKMEELSETFQNSDYSKQLTADQIDISSGIIVRFTESMYDYHLQTYENWEPYALECICLDIFPRKVSAEIDYFKAIYPVLTTFFSFLNNKGILTDNQANHLKMKLYEISDLIVEYAADPRHWGIAKSMMMEAIEAGIDMEDEAVLTSFL